MRAFAGWVALTGTAPPLDRLKPWQDWLTQRLAAAEPVDIGHGWLLRWPVAFAGEGASNGVPDDQHVPQTDDGILAGDWWCEVGPTKDAAPSIARALLPADGQLRTVPAAAGGFALCHWQPAHRTLTLATDRLGCRPLFLARLGDHVLFSTDLPLLLVTPGLTGQLNLRAIVNMVIAADAGQPDDTLFEGVQRVVPGRLWRVGPSGTTSLLQHKPLQPAVPLKAAGPQDRAQTLREHVISAVHDSLSGARTPAVHLSGGLDSTAIACIAARALQTESRSLLALCSVLPDHTKSTSEEADEREYIAHVLAQERNIQPVWVTLPKDEHPFAALPAWFAGLGEAPWNTTTHALARLGEAGQAHGVDVVLSGFGGDLFASAPSRRPVTEMCLEGRWIEAFEELRMAIQQQGWRRTVRAELGPSIRRMIGAGPSAERPALITDAAWQAFLHDAQPHERAGASLRRLERLNNRRRMATILEPGHLNLPVGGMCQFLSRTYGQTMCLPLLDTRVLDLVLQLDPREFTRDGLSRSVFRRAMAGILPETIRLRPGKGPAFDPALMSHIVASRTALQAWANDPCRPAWQVLDRQTFLGALDQVRPVGRAHWKAATFQQVLVTGAVGQFLDWRGTTAC